MTVEPAESSHKWVDFEEADQLIICIRLCERPVFRKRTELLVLVGFFVGRAMIQETDPAVFLLDRVMLSYLLNVLCIYKT